MLVLVFSLVVFAIATVESWRDRVAFMLLGLIPVRTKVD